MKITYDKKCGWCGDDALYVLFDMKKGKAYSFCGICFWKFCKKMGEAYDVMRDKVIPEMKDIFDEL